MQILMEINHIATKDGSKCDIHCLSSECNPTLTPFTWQREPVIEMMNKILLLQPRNAVSQKLSTMLSPRIPSPRYTRRQLLCITCMVGRQHWLSMMNAMCPDLLLKARIFPALPRHVLSTYAPCLTPCAFNVLPMIPKVFLVRTVTIAVEMVRSDMP